MEILEEKDKEQMLFLLSNIFSNKKTNYFPLQNYINIERKQLFKIKKFQYYYFKKNTVDTKRAVLFLYKDSNDENVSILIFKDLSILKINLEAPPFYFIGSVFEVSYTENDITLYDSFLISGNKINYLTFNERIFYANDLIVNSYCDDFKFSTVYYFDNIEFLRDNLGENEEIFMIPNVISVLTGNNYSFLKWKNPEDITFCLKAYEVSDDLILYSTNFRKLIRFAKVFDNAKKSIQELENYKNECMVEFNIIDSKMVPRKVIEDKEYPTSIRIIEKILSIKEEKISFDELIKN